MSLDIELETWRREWQSETAVPPDLRRHVERQSRWLKIGIAADILVTVVIGGGVIALAARSQQPHGRSSPSPGRSGSPSAAASGRPPQCTRRRLWICRSDDAAPSLRPRCSAPDSLSVRWCSAWDGSTGTPPRACHCCPGYSAHLSYQSTASCGCFRWRFSSFSCGTGGRSARSWSGCSL